MVNDGDIFENCTFVRQTLVKIFKGKKDLLFIDCNLTNCILPTGAKTFQCLEIEVDFAEVQETRDGKKKGKPYMEPTFKKKIHNDKIPHSELKEVLKPHKKTRLKQNPKARYIHV